MSIFSRIAATTGLMLLAGFLGAQQAPDADPLYHVEIIVFENLEASRVEEDFFHGRETLGSEPAVPLLRLPNIELESVTVSDDLSAVFGDQASTPEPGERLETQVAQETPETPVDVLTETLTDSLELFAVSDGPSGAAATRTPAEGAFRILVRDELELVRAASQVDRLSAYRLIAHVGWVQPGVGPERAPEIDLARLGITNPTGTIQIYRQRFLHAIVDLTFRDGRGSFWLPGNEFGLHRLEYAPSYRHTHERNAIYSGALHHIDHPLFGIMLRITPAPEPEEEEPADAGSDGPAA